MALFNQKVLLQLVVKLVCFSHLYFYVYPVVSSQYSKYFKDYVYPYRTHDVFECEFILMEAMDCSLVVFHPYRPLLNFCNDLKPHLLDLAEEHLQRAWLVLIFRFLIIVHPLGLLRMILFVLTCAFTILLI